jgi:hypothetical protein
MTYINNNETSQFFTFKNIFVSSALIFLALSTKAYAQNNNVSYHPGLLLQRSVEPDKVYQISLGVTSDRKVVDTTQLPLALIKGNRINGQLTRFRCDDANGYQRCIIFAKLDGVQEVWHIERDDETMPWTMTLLPDLEESGETFFLPRRSSASTDAPLAFTGHHKQRNITQLKVALVGRHSKQGLEKFPTKDLPNDEIPFTRPVYNSNDILAIFLISKNSTYVSPNRAHSIDIFSRKDGFKRIKLPDDCIAIGAMNDSILCISWSGNRQAMDTIINGVKLVYIDPPEDGHIEATPHRRENQPFHVLDGEIILTGYVKGIARPLAWNPETRTSRWLIDSKQAPCYGENLHAQIIGLTTERDAVLLQTGGLLEPYKSTMYPLANGLIDICGGVSRSIEKNPALFDKNAYNVTRLSEPFREDKGKSRRVPAVAPFALIKGKVDGPLSGKLMIYSYGVYGISTNEDYIGNWAHYWLDQGGDIAIVHLPGSGGYDADWRIAGNGIIGKFYAAKVLNAVIKNLRNKLEVGKKGITLLSESAGGLTQAYIASIHPEYIDALVLRAGCIDFDLDKKENCSNDVRAFGNGADPAQRKRMAKFRSLDRLKSDSDAPLIIFGIPERDDRLDRDYQLKIANSITPDRRKIINLPGVNHTERLDAAGEERWVKAVVDAVIAESNRKAAGGLSSP